jgi:low temperature requirement protein LtrA
VERRVSPLELFFDLVFVFAFTQVTGLLADEPTWGGLLRGLLVLVAVWWAWSAFAWLTNSIDPTKGGPRLVMLTAMAAMLIAALAVPGAFGGDALVFGIAYLAVRVLHVVVYAVISPGRFPRSAVLRFAHTAVAGPLLILLAAAFAARSRSPSGPWRSRSTSAAPISAAPQAGSSPPSTSPSASGSS